MIEVKDIPPLKVGMLIELINGTKGFITTVNGNSFTLDNSDIFFPSINIKQLWKEESFSSIVVNNKVMAYYTDDEIEVGDSVVDISNYNRNDLDGTPRIIHGKFGLNHIKDCNKMKYASYKKVIHSKLCQK